MAPALGDLDPIDADKDFREQWLQRVKEQYDRWNYQQPLWAAHRRESQPTMGILEHQVTPGTPASVEGEMMDVAVAPVEPAAPVDELASTMNIVEEGPLKGPARESVSPIREVHAAPMVGPVVLQSRHQELVLVEPTAYNAVLILARCARDTIRAVYGIITFRAQ